MNQTISSSLSQDCPFAGALTKSLPKPKRQHILLHERAAAGTFPRLVPRIHPMRQRHGTSNLELRPFEPPRHQRQAIHDRIETRRSLCFPQSRELKIRKELESGIRQSQPHDRIEDDATVPTGCRLDREIKAAVGSPGNLSLVAAFWAFKLIRTAHGQLSFWPLAEARKKWVGRDSNPGPMP